MSRPWLLALIILVVPLGGTPALEAANAPLAPWWDPPQVTGPQDFRLGWNLRAPIQVRNPNPYPLMAGETTFAHLDLGQLAAEAGWPNSPLGDLRLPRGLTIDPDSLRLVRYENQWSRILGEVPSRVHPTWYEPDQSDRFGRTQTEPFEPGTSALVTIVWRLPDAIDSGRSQYYFAYFDGLQNSDKAPARYDDVSEERLDATHWLGRGTVFYGTDPGQSVPNVEFAGIYANTRVSLFLYPTGLPKPRPDTRPGAPASLTLGAGEIVRYPLQLGPGPVDFKLVSDKPILASTFSPASPGGAFVPSLDRGAVGTDFLFPARSTHVVVTALVGDPPESATVALRPGGGGSIIDGGELQPGESRAFALAEFAKPYRLQSDQDVVVQLAPHSAAAPLLTQMPSAHGSPVGRLFFAAGRTGSGSPNPVIEAIGEGAPARLQVFDPLTRPEAPLFPDEGTPASLGAGPSNRILVSTKTFPASAGLAHATNVLLVRSATCEEWPCGSNENPEAGRMELRIGQASASSSAYGGAEGKRFQFVGPFRAFAHYDATQVRVERPGGSEPPQEFLLDADMPLEFDAPTTVPVLLTSDKPLTVFPKRAVPGAYHTYLPPAALPVDTVVGLGELRGFLVRLTSPFGEEPIFVAGRPGDRLVVPLRVENAGRWSDGRSLDDAIRLDVRPTSPWPGTARVEPAQALLRSGESQEGQLVIEVPPGVTGASTFQVTATSAGNPSMQSDLEVVVLVQESFGVRLWFGDAGSTTGPATTSLRVLPGAERILGVVLQNTGNAVDSFRLAAQPPGGQWSIQLLRNGAPVSLVSDVSPQGRVPLTLRITSPADQSTASVAVPIDAISMSSESAVDRITAFLRLDLGHDVRLHVDEPALGVDPGEDALFRIRATNAGREPANLLLRIAPQLAPNWTAAFDGTSAPDAFETVLFPAQNLSVDLRIHAPEAARHLDLGTVLALAEVGDEPRRLADAVTVAAIANHVQRLRVDTPRATTAAPGERVDLVTNVTNLGNGFVRIVALPRTLPPGWNMTTAELRLPPGASGSLHLPTLVPSLEAAGAFLVRVGLEGGDAAVVLAFPVDVRRVHLLDASVPAGPVWSPAERRVLRVNFANRGNGPETLTLDPLPASGWSIELAQRTLLVGRGQTGAVPFVLAAPVGAPDGAASHVLRVRSQENGSAFDVHFVSQLGRPDLKVVLEPVAATDAKHFGDVVFVKVRVRNDGRTPAANFTVALRRGPETLDSVPFARLTPGSEAIAIMRAPLVTGEELRVHVDPEGRVPDLDRTNNDAVVAIAWNPEVVATPSHGMILALAAAAVALLRGGRR